MKRNLMKFLLTFCALFVIKAHALSLTQSSARDFPYAYAPMNLVLNPSCAKNTDNITDADSIVTANDATALTQDGDCAIDADASGEFAEWDVVDASADARFLDTQNCEAKIYYEGDASDYDFEVYIGSNEVNSVSLLNASNGYPLPQSLNFPCGDLTNDPKIRITSTDAGAAAINVAKLYVGVATNVGSVQDTVAAEFTNSIDTSFTDGVEAVLPMYAGSQDARGIIDASNNEIDLPFTGWYSVSFKVITRSSGTWTEGDNIRVRRFIDGASDTEVFYYELIDGSSSSVGYNDNISDLFYAEAGQTLQYHYRVAGDNRDARINEFAIEGRSVVSEQVFKAGFPGQDWTAYTPSSTISTNVTVSGKYQCNAGNLKVRASFDFTGANTEGTVRMDLPSGFTIDTAKLTDGGTANVTPFGQVVARDTGTASYPGVVAYSDTNTVVFRLDVDDSGSASNNISQNNIDTSLNTPMTVAAGDQIELWFEVPVTIDSPCPRTSMPLLKALLVYDDTEVRAEGNNGVTTVEAGTYTPTLTNTTNISSSTAEPCVYQRIGNVVSVNCPINLTCTAGSNTTTLLEVSLPVASDFDASTDLSGGISSDASTSSEHGRVSPDTANDRAEVSFFCNSTSGTATRTIQFSYVVK